LFKEGSSEIGSSNTGLRDAGATLFSVVCRLVDSDRLFDRRLPRVHPGAGVAHGGFSRQAAAVFDLYRGDFLEEDDEDWVFAQREELRSVYFESVIELANIYIINGDRRKAEKLLLNTLAMDLYNEDVCLCLLKLYIATNQRGRAVKFYSSFADRFERELGIKPAQELAAAIKE
jgi:DNA-binding SARP family transcriptional activator